MLIDRQLRRAISLKQLKDEDFIQLQGQYRLRWDASSRYVQLLMKPILENKEKIFAYVQEYYRCFMKGLPAESFPVFLLEEAE